MKVNVPEPPAVVKVCVGGVVGGGVEGLTVGFGVEGVGAVNNKKVTTH